MPSSEIIPELPYSDVREAVNWLCRSFGLTERLRIGTHRAQLNVDTGSVVVTEGNASAAECGILVRVADLDSHYQHATNRGVRIINPPTEYPYGERQYTAEDLGGHRWTFSQTIADVDPADWGGVYFE